MSDDLATNVLKALEEIDAYAEQEASLRTTGLVSVVGAATEVAAKPGGTYIVASYGATITMPAATTQDWAGINGRSNREIVVRTAPGITTTLAAATSSNRFAESGVDTITVWGNDTYRADTDGADNIYNMK